MKLAIFCLSLLAAICQGGEDIDALYAQGIDELRAGHLVPAAKLLAEASDKYEAAGNDAAAADAASALFWCRKKFSLAECTALHSADEKAAIKAEAIVARKVEPSNAEKALAKANSFAAGHQDDQLLVAIKYFEVASLYKGSDFGFKAMDLSLAAMGRIKNEPARVAAKSPSPAPVKKVAAGQIPMASVAFTEQMGYTVTDLKPGISSHNNQVFPWPNVLPKELEGRQFTQVVAGRVSKIKVQFRTAGLVYILVHSDWAGYPNEAKLLEKLGAKKTESFISNPAGMYEVWTLIAGAGVKVEISNHALVSDSVTRVSKIE